MNNNFPRIKIHLIFISHHQRNHNSLGEIEPALSNSDKLIRNYCTYDSMGARLKYAIIIGVP